jgi:hypothetical protein
VGHAAQGAESQPCRDRCPRGGRSSPETGICFFGSANGDEWFGGYVERASTVNGWEATKMGRDEVQGGARYFWSDVLMGAGAAPRHVQHPWLVKRALSEPCHVRAFVSHQQSNYQPSPSLALPHPLSDCLHPLNLSPRPRPPTTSAQAGNISTRTNLSPQPKPSQAPSIHTRDRKPHHSKAGSVAWRRDIHYRSTGWLSVSPISLRLQSFRASH